MKWEEVDIDAVIGYIKSGKDNSQDGYVDMVKDILNKIANHKEVSVKQKNIIKRYYICDVLAVDIFEDESIVGLTMEEIKSRLFNDRQ